MFPGLSADKLKEGIFVGPQIREVQKDTDFEKLLNLKELRAWEAFKSVCSGFLGNTRVPDYLACIEKLLVLRGYGVLNVIQDSFFPFTPQLLPAKPWSSEWWTWRKILPRHFEDGEQLSRQMEPWHDGRLLLNALGWHPGGKIHQIFLENTLLTVCGTMNCVIVSSKCIDSISVLYLSCFICYKLLQLLKYAHIFSVYTKMRLFQSQKTRGDRAKLFINLNSAHPN